MNYHPTDCAESDNLSLPKYFLLFIRFRVFYNICRKGTEIISSAGFFLRVHKNWSQAFGKTDEILRCFLRLILYGNKDGRSDH